MSRGPSPCRAAPGPHSAFPSRIRNAVNCLLETLAQLHLVDEEAVAGALFVPLYDFAMQRVILEQRLVVEASRSM